MKRFVFVLLGVYAWILFRVVNRLRSEGREHLAGLPKTNVLLVSNHQTYYMDVLGIHSAIAAQTCGPLDGFRHNLAIRFVAAVETLNERGVLPRIFKYAGAVLVRRSWRDGEQELQRAVDPNDVERIREAIRSGWVITFPTGTTTPGAPVRKGTAHIIRESMPVVVPVSVDRFDQAFRRKGLGLVGYGVDLVVRFGPPLAIAPDDSVEQIVDTLTAAMSPRALEDGNGLAA